MKNIFKSLMLVAVAAMAFTACQKDNDELNNVNDQVVIEFNAGFDTTRSGFGDKTGDGYPSFWEGGEKVCVEVFSNNGSWDVSADAIVYMQKKDDAGTQGFFSATLNGNIYDNGTIYATTPRDSWYGWSGNFTAIIPAEQTPRVNSVDPAAHILWAEYEYSGAISTGYNLTFQHGVAYGKMTLDLEGAVDFANIKSVLVNINEKAYTLNPSELEAPTFWFACEEGAVETFKVTIVDNEDNLYSKEIDNVNAAKPLAFVNGEVSVFTVGGFEIDDTPYITNVSVFSTWPLQFTLTTKLAEEIMIYVNTGLGDYNMLPEAEWDPENEIYGFMSDDYGNSWKGAGENGELAIEFYAVGIAKAETGYHLDFYIGYPGYDVETGENFVIASYDGIVEGVNNPPMPEKVTATEAPATINGSYSWNYNLDFEVSGYNVDLQFSTDDETGLIAVGQYEVSGTTTLIEKDSWNFSLSESTITVAHDGENYVLTFDLTDAYGNTFDFTYTGQLTTEVGDKLLHPGDATPLATPEFIVDPVVAPTSVTLTWGAVAGAGNYELYYSYYDDGEQKSTPVETENTTYTFEGLAMNTDYTFYLKALPADPNANTESETTQRNAKTTIDPATWVADTTVTFTTAEVAEGNVVTFSNGEGKSLKIPFNPSLESVKEGQYVDNHGYPQGYDEKNYDANNIVFDGNNSVWLINAYFLEISIEGDTKNLVFGCSKNDGTTYMATFSGAFEFEVEGATELTSAVATLSTSFSTSNSGGWNITFSDGNGTEIVYVVQTTGHTYLKAGDWNPYYSYSEEGYISSVTWPGVSYPWPYTMTVTVVDGEYDITLNCNDYNNGMMPYSAHFKGEIEGFTLPE